VKTAFAVIFIAAMWWIAAAFVAWSGAATMREAVGAGSFVMFMLWPAFVVLAWIFHRAAITRAARLSAT